MKNEPLNNAIRSGLDFFIENQCVDDRSADFGRFPWYYDSVRCETIEMSHNWTTAIVVDALLAGGRFFKEEKYYDAASKGIEYIKTLQFDTPVFREITPQSTMAHPRDALTAALACLNFSQQCDSPDCFERARNFADWFIHAASAEGYPYWTVRFDSDSCEPAWCGSFHSGSAFFMYKMHQATGSEKYLTSMVDILDFYNTNHLNADGSIRVVLDRESLECISGSIDPELVKPGWITMHGYNDDFGALANLAAWKTTGKERFCDASMRYLEKMFLSQKDSGGFGPEDRDEIVPSAAGGIILELLAAQKLGVYGAEQDGVVRKAIQYLYSIQVGNTSTSADGGFLGVNSEYAFDGKTVNIRTSAYAVLALLKVAGEESGIYAISTNNVSKGKNEPHAGVYRNWDLPVVSADDRVCI